MQTIAAACLFLATKVEEVHKKVKHFISIAYCCQHELDALPFEVGSPPYIAYRDQLLDAERRLLYTLEMDVAVEQPYALATHQIKKWRDSGRFGTHADKPMELAVLDKAASDVAFDWYGPNTESSPNGLYSDREMLCSMNSELCLLFTAKELAVGALWIAWHSITLADRFALEDKDFGALLDLRLLGAVVNHYIDMSNWNLSLEARIQAASGDASSSPAASGTLFSRTSSDLSNLSFAALGPGIALLPFSDASPSGPGAISTESAKLS
jgi:hypothetical protein